MLKLKSMKKRWWLLLGLLLTGVAVYAKENPNKFLITSTPSLTESETPSQTQSSGFFNRIEEKLKGVSGREEPELAEPQSITKKQEVNFIEATISGISSEVNETTSSTKSKAAAVAECLGKIKEE